MEEQEQEFNEEQSNVNLGFSEGPVYPPKPIVQEADPQSGIIRSLFSTFAYVGVAYFLLDWEIDFILKIVIVLLVHELGHYLAMRMFNYKDVGIFFIPFLGAAAKGTKDEISVKQDVIISLAGPIPGIIIGLIIFITSQYIDTGRIGELASIFIFLNLFNLLPLMPLDGGRVMNALFFERSALLGLIFFGVSTIIIGFIAIQGESWYFLIFPLFMIRGIWGQYKNNQIRKALEKKGISTSQKFDDLSDKDYWLIREEMGNKLTSLQGIIKPGKYMIAQAENRIIAHMKGLVKLKPIQDLSGWGKFGFAMFWAASFVMPLIIYLVIVARAAYFGN